VKETLPLLIDEINRGFVSPHDVVVAVAEALLSGNPIFGSARYHLPKGIKIVILKEAS
jgi:hypothetical protein